MRWSRSRTLYALALPVALVLVGIRIGRSRADLQVWLFAIAVVVVVCAVCVVLYGRAARRLTALTGPGGWGARCVDPRTPLAWRFLLLDDVGVWLVGRRGEVCGHLPWGQVGWAYVDDVTVGFTRHPGLVLPVPEVGDSAEFLLPSRTTLSYPRSIAEQARDEINRRLERYLATWATQA